MRRYVPSSPGDVECQPIDELAMQIVRTRVPVNVSSSSSEPMHTILPVTSLIQIGNGVPQMRLREIDQSIAPLSQLPKRPCLMWRRDPANLFVRRQQVVDDVE